ncbi:MAG TPA: MFS transporter [Ferrovibrio sp.]|uniref:MFS transporter n=1 Tax=Ferrovibrio sp. TaxID=1917215 RepID=UPI002ED48D48
MSNTIPASAATPMVRPDWRRWCGLAVMLTGTFMAILDVFIVNIAVPSIRADLQADFAAVQFVVAGYALPYAVMLITGGRLGDIFGRRRMFMLGLAGFTLASLACGLAADPTALIAARLAQGLAAAVMSPQVFALMRVGFPGERERATAFAWLGVVIGLSSVAGQLLGGLLVEADLFGLAWRPVFLINLPLGLVALLAAPRLIAESRAEDARRLDLAGVAGSALGLTLLLYPLIEGREAGWPAWAFAMLAAALPVLALFLRDQQRKSRQRRAPLLEMRLFGNPVFARGVVIVLAFYSTQNAFYLALTVTLQAGLGLSPLQAGLVFAPLAIAFMASSILAGRMTVRHRHIAVAGGAALAAFAFLVTAWTACTAGAGLQARALVAPLALLGIGCGLFMTPLLNTLLGSIPGRDSGSASGMITTMQQVGGAFGVALVGIAVFGRIAAGGAAAYPQALGYAAAYGCGGCAVVFILMLRLRRLQRISAA